MLGPHGILVKRAQHSNRAVPYTTGDSRDEKHYCHVAGLCEQPWSMIEILVILVIFVKTSSLLSTSQDTLMQGRALEMRPADFQVSSGPQGSKVPWGRPFLYEFRCVSCDQNGMTVVLDSGHFMKFCGFDRVLDLVWAMVRFPHIRESLTLSSLSSLVVCDKDVGPYGNYRPIWNSFRKKGTLWGGSRGCPSVFVSYGPSQLWC